MKRRFTTLLLSVLMTTAAAETSLAVPAAPYSHQLQQNDNSSFAARKWGDENLSGWETEDGYTILFDDNLKSWVYAVHDKDEKLVGSNRQVGRNDPPGLVRKKLRPGAKATAGRPQKTISPAPILSASEAAVPAAAPAGPNLSPPVSTAAVPVILVNFNGTTSSYDAADIESLLFGSGTWSMADYYSEVSYGAFSVSSGPAGIIGWVTAAQNHDYYGQNDTSGNDLWPGDLVYEAVVAADTNVNFAPYDHNGDCYVDAVNILHQGTGEEASPTATDIWSHSWSLVGAQYWGKSHYGVYTTNDVCTADPGRNVKINNYVIQPELLKTGPNKYHLSTMGVFAHEYGHVLGLPDLYDTDGSSEGVGNWSLMASGSWNMATLGGDRPAHLDPWSKSALGWSVPTTISASVTAKTFGAVESANDIYRLLSGNSEYFLLENRQKSGFDAGLPGGGLLLWHIDEAKGDNKSEWYPGCSSCSSHYKVALVQADGLFEMEKNIDRGDGGDPFPGTANKQSVSIATTPANNLYNGTSSGFRIAGISSSGPTMTADITVLDTAITSAPADPANLTDAAFAFTSPEPGAIFECSLDASPWSACTSPASFTGLADGSHSFSVRAKDAEGAIDLTPAVFTWVIDTLPPETSMDSSPPSQTAATSAGFSFSSPDAEASFSCSLDTGSWTTCSSPVTYSNLPPAEHNFQVRARDLAGNDDPSPTAWNWTITQPYVKLVAAGQPEGSFSTISAAISSFPAGSAPSISLQSLTFTETVDINRCDEQITLKGGYNPDFSAIIGQTILDGSINIFCGTLIIDNMVII
jgi:M6 family metalloprotease-like protein